MKYKTTLLIIVTLIAQICCIQKTYSTVSTTFNQNDPKLYVQYAHMLICAQKPLETTCSKCVTKSNGFSFFYFYHTSRLRLYPYKFMIHYNDEDKKVIVSFSGPSVKTYPQYVQLIYSQGFRWVKEYSVQVENEYNIVYYKQLRRHLVKQIRKILQSGRSDFQFIFTGHSIGGSLATLASYDLHHSGVLNKDRHKTQVYTYGGLRIGDRRLVTLVNREVTLFRIIRNDDFVVRIPSCYYSVYELGWRCFTQNLINSYITVPTSPLFFYMQNYRYSTFYSIPVYTAIHSWAVSYRRTSFLEMETSRAGVKSKSHQIVRNQRKDDDDEEDEEEKKKKELLKKRRQRNKQNRFEIYKNRRSNLLNRRDHLEKLKKENERRRREAQLARLEAEKRRHAQQNSEHKSSDHGEVENKVSNAHQTQRLSKLKEKEEEERKARLEFEKSKRAKSVIKKKQPQQVKIVKQHKNEAKKSIPPPPNVLPKVKLISPQIVQLPKLQMTPQLTKTYYFTNIYYTQPYGQLIYYTNGFVSYTVCPYVHFVSVCEKRIVLPSTFVITSHLTYYEEVFDEDECLSK